MPKVENITKKFGGLTVFNNFSLEFKTDKITAIAGVSGVGKTTLLNIIAGLEPCDGNVYCDRPVSYVFQTPRLIENATVKRNLEPVAKAGGYEKSEGEKKIDELLASAEIFDRKNSLAGSLSGGQQQRVSIVRAFLFPAKIMLLDEPFSSLDLALKVKLMDLYARLLSENPRTVIMVSHDADEALALADEIVVIKNSSECERIALPEKTSPLRDPAGENCAAARKKLYNALGVYKTL